MLIDLKGDLSPVKHIAEQITSLRLTQFNEAVGAKYAGRVAPSFGTTFRKAEFDFLGKMKVDLRNLLHTEQDYDYVSQFQEGDIPEIETKLFSAKERRGMVFVTLETEVKANGQLRLRSVSSFVLRENQKGS